MLAPSTLRNLVSLLRSIYSSAVLDRLAASSPVVRVALPRHERKRVVPLSVVQVQQLADAMPARNRAMVVTQAGLGLRIGELLALRVDDVIHVGVGKVCWQEVYGSVIFTESVKLAGLPEGTTTHDLGHHHASVLLAAGESVVAVADRLGHENATLVLSTYGHVMPDTEDRTRRAVDEAWSAIVVPSGQAGES